MKNLLIAVAMPCLCIVTSCATGPPVTQSPNPSTRDARLATVTVLRKSQIMGAAVKVDVQLDAVKIARIGTGDRVEFQVSPDKHFVCIPWRDPLIGPMDEIKSFQAEAGRTYFFYYSASMTGPELKQLSQEEGEREVASNRYRLITL